ncbi:hypothetical protein K492DRAFT_215793 [Lichtheimia hyalospora FSU 10163]|nr:hypothetical protein K492DRAFT_215793 [Lichtheimia hyalospora FSU 10163]
MNDTLLDLDMFRRFLLPATLSEEARRSTRLPEFYDELENDQSSTCTARLILHQLRWSEYIVDPQALSGKLIEAMVVYLKELMNENSELTVPILDALSNLTSHSESLEDVRDTVLDRLEQAEQDDLAVILKFLLQTVSSNTIDLVIYGIREKLDFRTLGRPQSARQRTGNAAQGLILESIKLGLQFHKFVCDSWFKSIAALETKEAHKAVDILVLVILYSMTSTKKKAELLFRKKITGGLITARLLQDVILDYADGLTSYWNAILSLAESLLRSAQQTNVIAPCSNALYINAFKCSDAYHRQEIVGSLVTHIGSGSISFFQYTMNNYHIIEIELSP